MLNSIWQASIIYILSHSKLQDILCFYIDTSDITSLFLILIVLVFLNCVVLNNISARIGLPTLLAFIVLGIVFGNVGAISVYLSVSVFP